MKRVLVVLAVCAAVATSAMADPTVMLMDTETSPGLTVRINSSGYDGTTGAGLWNLDVQSPGYDGINGAVQGLCIDVWDRNPETYRPYEVVSLDKAPDPGAAINGMGEAKARRMAELLNRYWLESLSTVQAAALQLAVWEIVDEALPVAPASYDVKSGGFSVVSGVTSVNSARDLANTWLRSLSAEGCGYDNYLALTNNELPGVLGLYQDYVVRVPVPGAVLLGLLGLSAAGLRLRRSA